VVDFVLYAIPIAEPRKSSALNSNFQEAE
jgi:hypothetical protein